MRARKVIVISCTRHLMERVLGATDAGQQYTLQLTKDSHMVCYATEDADGLNWEIYGEKSLVFFVGLLFSTFSLFLGEFYCHSNILEWGVNNFELGVHPIPSTLILNIGPYIVRVKKCCKPIERPV